MTIMGPPQCGQGWARAGDSVSSALWVSSGSWNHERSFRAGPIGGPQRALFPGVRAIKNNEMEFGTTAGGGRIATSIGGTLTGRGADIIIIDDPLKAEDAMSKPARDKVIGWYGSTLVARLNDKQTICRGEM